jgi:hypothetical protein
MATPFQNRIRKRRALVDSFRASGMTRTAFCQRNKIALSTLDWWLRKLRDEQAGSSDSGGGKTLPLFIPITPERTGAHGSAVELHFPDGRKLILPATTGIEDIVRIVRESVVSA